jgi:hypothetical protein
MGLLENKPDTPSDEIQGIVLQIDAIDVDLTMIRIIQPADEIRYGGLPK